MSSYLSRKPPSLRLSLEYLKEYYTYLRVHTSPPLKEPFYYLCRQRLVEVTSNGTS